MYMICICHACQYVCISVHYLFFDRMHVIAPISYYTSSLLLGFSTQSRCVHLDVGECVRLPAPLLGSPGMGRLFPQLSRWLASSLLLGSGSAGMDLGAYVFVASIIYLSTAYILLYTRLLVSLLHITIMFRVGTVCLFCGVIPFTVISGPQKHPSALQLLFCGQPFARHCPAGECPLAVDSKRVA